MPRLNPGNRTKQWHETHARVKVAVIDLLSRNYGSVAPTIKEVAKELGMGISSVSEHLKELKFDPEPSPLRVLTPEVILNLYNLTKVSAPAVKLWMQIMEGWSEPNTLDVNIRQLPPILFQDYEITETKVNE